MWQKVFFIVSTFCLCLLAGCSTLPPDGGGAAVGDLPSDVTSPSEDSRLVLETIAFAQRAAGASADDQRKEIVTAARIFARERSVGARLRYALLLSMPSVPGADAHRALATLEPLSAGGTTGPVRQLATLLVSQIGERLKEQRRAQQLKEQLDESRASEKALSEKAAQLKMQLDELRAIERALIERGRPKK